MMERVYIGIDPDTDKNGVAVVSNTGDAVVGVRTFPELMSFLTELSQREECKHITIVIEDSWSTSHNWHYNATDSKAVVAKKGYAVGRCHQVGKLIAEMCKAFGLQYRLQAPLQKIWKGHDRKITHEEIKKITGIKNKRTNQEERDALLLAWVVAGLPIKI